MKNMVPPLLSGPQNITRRLILTLAISTLLIPLFPAIHGDAQSTLNANPFTPHEIRVLVISPDLLYASGAGLLVSDLARYGFNLTYHASSTSVNPDYLSDDKTALLDQYDVVILHGILGYPPSKVSVEELDHFTDYRGMLVTIGNALFTNETSGQFWENTFAGAPVAKLEQRLGIDFVGYLTTPFHNNGTFNLVDKSIRGLPATLSYTTVYNQSICRQFAITPTAATEIYNFTTQSGVTTAGVTFYRNDTTGAVGVYIQGSYIHADEVPISSRKIRYLGLTDTETRASLIGSLIAFSIGADIETVVKPQPLATIRLDGLGERAFNDAYLNASLANFDAAVDNYNIVPTITFTDFNDLYPQYWQEIVPVTLSQLKIIYRDWEYSSNLRNKNLTLMTQSEMRTLIQSAKSNFSEFRMDLFSTSATSAGLWNPALLEAMASEDLYLLDSARDHVSLVKDYSDWWSLRVISDAMIHNGVRMADKSVENFTQFGYSQDYLRYLYFSIRDRLALSVVNGFPSLTYGVSNFRWNQVGTYSMQTVYRNLTTEIPDIKFVPLVEAALYFGNKWARVENPLRDGSAIDFDLNASAIPDAASIGKGMVWLAIDSVENVADVFVDGQSWWYFDDHSIRLPASNVHVKVVLGERTAPSVISTTRKVSATSWNNRSFVVAVSAAAGLNVTIKMLIPQVDPFSGYWNVYCSEAGKNWGYAFDDSTRVLTYWAISDGSVTFSAGSDVVPPLIGRVSYSLTVYSAAVKVRVDITDSGSGVRNAALIYSISEVELTNTTMVLDGQSFTGAIPAFPFGAAVSFRIFAEDNAGNSQVSSVYNYRVRDLSPPLVGSPKWDPLTPSANQSVRVAVTVKEPEAASGVRYVKLCYSTDGKLFTSVNMESENDTWQAFVPPRNSSGQITFYVQAFDKAGNFARSRNYSYDVMATTLPLLPIVTAFAALVGVGGAIFYFVRIRRPHKASAPAGKQP